MATTSFVLSVSHSQIAVFDSAVAQPFSMWTERHVSQGFAWRNASASFRTIASGGPHLVEVAVLSSDVELSLDAARIVQVPFEVPASGAIEIASIADSLPLELPSGVYQLRFECFRQRSGSEPRIKLTFIRRDDPIFEVLRADAELSLTDQLLLYASPT
jgi:Competence protein J (ComJ)